LDLRISYQATDTLEKADRVAQSIVQKRNVRQERLTRQLFLEFQKVVKFMGTHKSTLESIEIGYLPNDAIVQRAVLSGFRNLERLTLYSPPIWQRQSNSFQLPESYASPKPNNDHADFLVESLRTGDFALAPS
jgi:hypothetical protein